MSSLQANPFGSDIGSDDVLETLSFFDDWEERYKYIIDLGKQLPAMPAAKQTEAYLLRGCQSQVWIDSEYEEGKLVFEADSDAHIVRGLLAIVLAAFNQKTPEQILAFDVEDYFARIDLLKHLSPTRGNGIRSMVKRIQDTAQAHS
ncbi:MAG: hypothetical protein RL217_1334 [Pseudomonadota bacterium]|jgi:cysteine desulfuration protein SufE